MKVSHFASKFHAGWRPISLRFYVVVVAAAADASIINNSQQSVLKDSPEILLELPKSWS